MENGSIENIDSFTSFEALRTDFGQIFSKTRTEYGLTMRNLVTFLNKNSL